MLVWRWNAYFDNSYRRDSQRRIHCGVLASFAVFILPIVSWLLETVGAAVSMGSLLSAIAFFSEKDKSAVSRPKLLDALFRILKSGGMNGNANTRRLIPTVRRRFSTPPFPETCHQPVS